MGNLSAYARLFRIEHAMMLAVAVVIAELLVSGAQSVPLPALPLLLLSLCVPIFMEMGSFALNDYFDVKADKENRRKDRPIAFGEISPKTALFLAAACYILGVAAAFPLPLLALEITAVFAFLSLAYNFKLKELPLVGNAYIAASMAIPFIFGNFTVSSQLYLPALAIACVAFVAGLGREIIKSAEDVEGDVKHRNARTLPAVLGVKNSAYIAAACYIALIPLSFLPFALGLRTNLLALSLVALASLSFAAMAILAVKSQKKENLTALRKTSLLALAVGLAGYCASLI
ncbi:MAG: UbiA family prenyltransferase [Candidatus Micrarchaeota archaeon]|nr:UbiA family prenyltransferase [Candidatus Micrarchaeota archaeon]